MQPKDVWQQIVYTKISFIKDSMKILIVEDNRIISDNIKKFLELEWIESFQLFSWKEVLFHLIDISYDLIILDLGLWESDGLNICKRLREKGNATPILMLTARTTTKQKVEWLETGADDYMTKPFEYDELLARIKSLIRRTHTMKWDIIQIWDISIHSVQKKVIQWKKEIPLSNLEFWLILYLAQHKWKIISKEELLEKVWGEYDEFEASRTVDVYVGYLRKKLWKDTIETKRWQWYLIP